MHGKANRLQAATDITNAGKGRHRGVLMGKTGHILVESGLPHIGVLRWSETIEKPGIDRGIQLGQGLQQIADQQGQGDAAIGQGKLLPAGREIAVMGEQLFGPGLQFRPERQGAAQVIRAQRVFFGADEVQAGVCRCDPVPQLPGTEKIQAGAETGFTDAEAGAGRERRPALRQIVVLQEHMARFLQP